MWPFKKKTSYPSVAQSERPYATGPIFSAALPGQDEHSYRAVADFHSETWRFVEQYCHERIAELRERNDNISHGEVQTAVIRGAIRELKNVLDLPKPKPEVPQDERRGGEIY